MSSLQVCQVSYVTISDHCTTEHLGHPQGGMWFAFYEGFTARSGVGVFTFQTQLTPKFLIQTTRNEDLRIRDKNPSNSKGKLISVQCMSHNT